MALTQKQIDTLNKSMVAMQRAQVGTLLQEMEAELALLNPTSIENVISDVNTLKTTIDGEGGLAETVGNLETAVGALALTKVSHTVVAGDVGETNTVVELAFVGTPAGAVITAIDNTGLLVGGYTVAYAENKVTLTIIKETLPVDSKVSAIIW